MSQFSKACFLRRLRWGTISLALLSPLAAGPGLWADTLVSPSSAAQCSNNLTGAISDPISCSQSITGASDSGNVTLFPVAGLIAQAAWQPGGYSASAFITLDYSFEITGGNPGDVVPFLVSTSLVTQYTGTGYGFSELLVQAFTNTSMTVCTDGTCGTSATQFSGALSATALSGTVDTVHLEVEAAAGFALAANTAYASADPCISIDPSFAAAGNYSVQVSPGVGNCLAPVPEPVTLPPLSFAGLLLILRSARKRARGH
jgi:hypothetical protein